MPINRTLIVAGCGVIAGFTIGVSVVTLSKLWQVPDKVTGSSATTSSVPGMKCAAGKGCTVSTQPASTTVQSQYGAFSPSQHPRAVPKRLSQAGKTLRSSSTLDDQGELAELQSAPLTSFNSKGRSMKRFVKDSNCEGDHWLDSVSDDGKIVKLEDGSVWEIDDVDAITSALWLATDDIVVCNGKLIDTDDKESVEARRIK